MRLLNTKSLNLEEFADNEIPQYAILSHTWVKEEVTFQDMQGNKQVLNSSAKFQKIRKCCEKAQTHNYQHVWIDTCCIDKSSSAELSEAINSMYRWYEQANVCYAYLADVGEDEDENLTDVQLRGSRWFTRGWTLQELIASGINMRFYTANWKFMGTKERLIDLLSDITSIDRRVLENGQNKIIISAAERMSWAAGRETTRIEDIAYSLLGLFDVNMPLLYGERERAFIRLQEEILKVSKDRSIFAWCDSTLDPNQVCGLLASHPKLFASTPKNLKILLDNAEGYEPFSVRGGTLHVKLPCWREIEYTTKRIYSAIFPCLCNSGNLMIILERKARGNSFKRVCANTLNFLDNNQASRFVNAAVEFSAYDRLEGGFPTPGLGAHAYILDIARKKRWVDVNGPRLRTLYMPTRV